MTEICELPHQSIEEEDACEQRRLGEEPGAALARYIADRPLSEIQAAFRILGWPPLQFEVVEDEGAAPDTGDDHSCAESGCSGEPTADES